ncbi:MarR family winged helix-turn-helix transcriptional regulator [Nocardioides sp.]|uniref:MarR family winged helix-turn-helix transcriptional regulator n=1 Tax=Nocardioides sp. TaxID=35761 RepID=UPI003D0EFAA8
MGNANDEIEQQLLLLLRRTQAIHVRTSSGDVLIERSSYGILCLILDEGPQRLGTIAQTFTLDPSTITRQVQAVVKAGLAEKTVDPSDRRAMLLSLTPEGRTAIKEARAHRRAMLEELMKNWTEDERTEFGRALRRFNTTVEEWNVTGLPESLVEQV